MPRAYYNEFDPFAAAWLRELITAGLIADGDVDERSIVDVTGNDVKGYTQCHFFAGIGGWSLALRMAGWPDEREVWTGSCPCQPFSSAGKRKGVNDERHVWPEFARLIGECSPAICFGEQVSGKDGLQWLAGVRADLETMGYAVGAADLCAASVGAPHIRQRLWWVADRIGNGRARGNVAGGCAAADQLALTGAGEAASQPQRRGRGSRLADRESVGRRQAKPNDRGGVRTQELVATSGGIAGGLADSGSQRRQQESERSHGHEGADEGRLSEVANESASGVADGRVGDTESERCREAGRDSQRPKERIAGASGGMGDTDRSGREQLRGAKPIRAQHPPAQCAGDHWSNAIWLPCGDGKARRIEPTISPLVDGLPGRVGLLRGAGNAIVPACAATFIGCVMETMEEGTTNGRE